MSVNALSYLSAITISGEQAKDFLQGQVSCDMEKVTSTQASLGTLCSLKGRMIASFIIVEKVVEKKVEKKAEQAGQEYVLILHHSIAQGIIKDLKKYAIFSKAEIAASEYKVFAIHNGDEQTLLSAASNNEEVIIHLSRGRQLLVTKDGFSASDDALSDEQNIALDIQDELAWITEETTDKFLPQAFFSDASTAVSYEKGCYKGQEIVARMHFRGQMKEGLKVIENQNYTVGQELRDENKKLQGTVVWVTATIKQALAVMQR